MTYRLVVRGRFAAAHRITGAQGPCENRHGHNFKVALCVSGKDVNQSGMVVDFGILKKALREVLIHLDHTDLSEHSAFDGVSPSSEMIARYIYHEAVRRLSGSGAVVNSVTVSESDDASATYAPEESAKQADEKNPV